jgi:hypothetical protein
MRSAYRLFALAALASSAISCGDVARSNRTPVIVFIDHIQAAQGNHTSDFRDVLLSDVITNVTTPPPCTSTSPCPTIFADFGQITMHWDPKDPGNPTNPVVPSTNEQVTFNRYHIEYVRADGRNVPGVDVPFAFDGAATGTIQISSSLVLGFELVRHAAKQEAPLAQLRNSANVITTIARITFYGRDGAGNDISVTGQIQVDFGNFGDQ